MKASKFEYVRPRDVPAAVVALGADGAQPLAGGQSLGPMLNLRLARPALLVDLGHLPELRAVETRPDGVLFGAALTHAAFEDAVVPDPTGGVLAAVARGIAYRAVRNRGTIGGSLAHADPAADWPTVLAALGASVTLAGPAGRREMAVTAFVTGPFETALRPQEIVTGVFVPRLPRTRRWSYAKSCRKVGDFADAMTAILVDPERGLHRFVLGALESRAIVIESAGTLLDGLADVDEALRDFSRTANRQDRGLHRAVVDRALATLDGEPVPA